MGIIKSNNKVMTIEYLKQKHHERRYLNDSEHAKLSIEFAIEILEEIAKNEDDTDHLIWSKINELKNEIK
jgi:hypothetical protein